MMESYIQSIFADRIGGENYGKDNKIYKFEKIKRAKQQALKDHPDRPILDFGVGEPDDMADSLVRDALKKEVDDLANRSYADNGIAEYKEAAASFMKNVYGVSLNSITEINHTIGAKPALAMMPLAFINPGDVAMMTVPGYPVFGTHSKYLGGEVYNLELKAENHFLPDLDHVPKDVLKRAKVLVINYPNNPTGAGATADFYKKVIAFAKEHSIIVIQDAAYAALVYNKKPLSFLSVEGAKDVGIEIHSMSKAFNMTGWRLGFVCGNELIVKAFMDIKDNIDSGQFRAIQKASVKALGNTQLIEKITTKYERRLKLLVAALNKKGFEAKMPDGSFFLYVRAPKSAKGKMEFPNGESFSQFLITEKSVSTVPWDDAGHFVRFSATFEARSESDEIKVIQELEHRLSDLSFEF